MTVDSASTVVDHQPPYTGVVYQQQQQQQQQYQQQQYQQQQPYHQPQFHGHQLKHDAMMPNGHMSDLG